MTFSDRYNTLSSSLFLEACNGNSVERTPVWFMRQAGRILPKYRQIRKRYNSIQTLFKTPELAAEITVMPIKELGVDAAILYTDLVTPLEPLGCPYHYSPGPVFEKSLNNRKDILDLKIVDCESDLAFIEKTIKITINSLPIDIPLIGYSGSPFTLASWLVEGQSSKDFPAIRKLIYSDPKTAHLLLQKLTKLVIDFLTFQINNGVNAVQIFDTSVGVLPSQIYSEFVAPYLRAIFCELNKFDIPRIYFPLNSTHLIKEISTIEMEVISVDWRVDINECYSILGKQCKAIQGNLDPLLIYSDKSTISNAIENIFNDISRRPHIFNLGHGFPPDVPLENVKFVVDEVHRLSKIFNNA